MEHTRFDGAEVMMLDFAIRAFQALQQASRIASYVSQTQLLRALPRRYSQRHRQVALRSSRVAKGRHERRPVNPPLPRFPLSSRDHRPRRVALSPFHAELPRY
jgi:CBS-domain-containing membrane protein